MSIQEKDDPITQNTPLSQSGKLEIDNEYHRQCPPQHVAKVESRRAKLIPPQHRRMFSESRRAKLIPPHSGVTGRPAISHELPFPVCEIAVGAVRAKPLQSEIPAQLCLLRRSLPVDRRRLR